MRRKTHGHRRYSDAIRSVGPRAAWTAVILGALAFAPLQALEPTGWKNTQSFSIERPGLIRIALPPSTFDAAGDHLQDLRLLDPAGHETPYLLQYAAPITPPTTQRPKLFRSSIADSTTQVLVETGTAVPLAAIELATPAPSFLKAARVETSPDGEQWHVVLSGAPLFRQFGVAQLKLDLDRQPAAYVRITVDDARTPPIPFTGATLALASTTQPAPTSPLAAAHIVRREEFAGETALTLDLGARNVPIASVEIDATDPIFTRAVKIGIREIRDETAVESTLASGTIFRVAVDGLPSTAQLAIPASFSAPTRELVVHIANGDSPPLAIEGIHVAQRPVWMVFAPVNPGTYTLLTGNSDVQAPHYDLSELGGALKAIAAAPVAIGAVEPNPAFQKHDVLAETPLLGGSIDPSGWRYSKSVQLASSGVQQLELDIDVLAGTQNNLSDVRLVRDGLQIPYLIERPMLSRRLPLAIVAADDRQQPRTSRWQIKLPHAGIPISDLTFTSSSALFQRHMRVFESVADGQGTRYDRTLADGEWRKTPDESHHLVLTLSATPATDTLWVETDNGDNPRIELTTADATYRVARLLFKSEARPLTLFYGNPQAPAPRYDIALISAQLISAEKNIATLGPEQTVPSHAWNGLGSIRAGVLFWTVLGLVVVVLLVVVAKLLPKPPAST